MNRILDRRSPWSPGTKHQREEVLAELGRILTDPRFSRSDRYSSLLRYLVEMTLDNKAGELKERTIGTSVFHRSADYDTNEDPVVRFCAGEIRKRLAQYFLKHPEARFEIELPIGSYVPLFWLRPIALEPAELAVLAESPELPGAVAPPAEPTAPTAPVSPVATASHRTVIAAMCASAVIVVACLFFFSFYKDPLKQFWGPLLTQDRQVYICTGTPPPGFALPADSTQLSIQQQFDFSGHRVSLATASTIASVSGVLQAHRKSFDLSEADSTSLDSLRGHPLILINANNNKWTLLLLKPLRFHFESQGELASIVDAQTGKRDWNVDFSRPNLQQTEDYAIVGRFFDPTTESPVVVLAGIGSNGTKAAGEFAVSPQSLKSFSQIAPRGWEKKNFEVVLKAQVVQGHLGSSEIVASTFW